MQKKNIRATGQYLSFVLADELYALDIGKVREVLELQPITRIPRMPEHMRGIINLRGNAVPVVDLRMKFGMGSTKSTVDTCIIIVEVQVDNEELVVGALADSVREVFEMETETILPPPKVGTKIDTAFLHGMGKIDDRFVLILDVDKVFSTEELTDMTEVPQVNRKSDSDAREDACIP
jgi:purine-binding chemotaxis protein CheW